MPKPSHSRSSSNEPALGKELFLQVWPILSRWIVQNDLGAVPASLALWWEMAGGRHHGQAVGRHGQAHSSLEPIDRTATDFMPPLVMEAWQCVHHWMSEVIEARKVVAADRFFKRHLLHHAFSVWVENTDSLPSLVSGTNSEDDALVEPEGASDDTTDSSDSGHADQDAKIARLQKIIEETDKVLADIVALQEKIKAITATGPEPAVGGSAGPVLGGPEPAIGGSVPNWSDCTSQEFLDNAPHCNILLAGFPCQPWSVAGKGQGKNDVRGRAAQLTGPAIGGSVPPAIGGPEPAIGGPGPARRSPGPARGGPGPAGGGPPRAFEGEVPQLFAWGRLADELLWRSHRRSFLCWLRLALQHLIWSTQRTALQEMLNLQFQ